VPLGRAREGLFRRPDCQSLFESQATEEIGAARLE